MKVTSLRYLDAKFHHPSLGASSLNRGNRISCVQNSRKTENRNSLNNSGIGILCSKNSNERLAFPAVAGLLVFFNQRQSFSFNGIVNVDYWNRSVERCILQCWRVEVKSLYDELLSKILSPFVYALRSRSILHHRPLPLGQSVVLARFT